MDERKKIGVKPLASLLLDISGTAKQQRQKLRDISFVYSKEFTPETVHNNFWFEDERVKITSRRLNIEDWHFFPDTLADFVSILSSMRVELFWDADAYNEMMYPGYKR